ncbi:MAG: hypothetical protein MI785_15945 [Kiloniellales bacterium]|nr:hypothetical protein [Kiloniellales bacterium]
MLYRQSLKARLLLAAMIAGLTLAVIGAAPAAADDDDDDDRYYYYYEEEHYYYGKHRHGRHWHKHRHYHHHEHKRRKRKVVEHHHHHYYHDDDDDDDWRPRRRAYVERWSQTYGRGIGHCNTGLVAGLLGGGAGAALGAAAGEGDPAAVLGGALAGILVGATLGQGIDLQDSYCMGETLQNAPDGSTIIWNNPRTEASYEVTPKASYERDDGRYCREFISTATVAGKEQEVYGTACWQPDGSWEIVQAK